MALTGPFSIYLDIIIDSFVLQSVITALGGFDIIITNITSFQSTVSSHLISILVFCCYNCLDLYHAQSFFPVFFICFPSSLEQEK